MDGPGEYVCDETEGITRVEDLPKAKIKQRSRKRKKQMCPYCGYMAYRDKVFIRKLHDLATWPTPTDQGQSIEGRTVH